MVAPGEHTWSPDTPEHYLLKITTLLTQLLEWSTKTALVYVNPTQHPLDAA